MIFGFGISRKGFGCLRKEKKKREELSWDSRWEKKKKKKKNNEGRRWSTGTRVLETRFPGGRYMEKVPTQT